ncbi:PREDICTED: uncharacterized protein LOC105960827 [Erythranthe guttata]|uniref:uncharacterized protein LOC105960827 n=1 Tax=Erythranthe guttata TaxID=4155 RepID=UPI00064E1188|nr:PREDICTED: uncharacterized protein LOC105960827 [Erythranthe guttata]|eukprot:XP_012840494.1 PREDICTED: uncharacterized protein LOC105960827 [Erythranthe guttata]
MVRTYLAASAPWDPRPKPRNANQLGSPPTAGLFTRVSSKPTNHSKFTGKCGRPKCRGCHDCPPAKSKDKVKGAHKVRSSSEIVSGSRFKLTGVSASGVVDYLDKYDVDVDVDADDIDIDIDADIDVDYDQEIEISSTDVFEIEGLVDVGIRAVVLDVDNDDDDDEDDDVMSFYEVGFNWGPVDGDESWCLVEEM